MKTGANDLALGLKNQAPFFESLEKMNF